MFESNFPMQKRWCSEARAWNPFKRLIAGASAEEKAALFAGADRFWNSPHSNVNPSGAGRRMLSQAKRLYGALMPL
jgi:hypothetical protein